MHPPGITEIDAPDIDLVAPIGAAADIVGLREQRRERRNRPQHRDRRVVTRHRPEESARERDAELGRVVDERPTGKVMAGIARGKLAQIIVASGPAAQRVARDAHDKGRTQKNLLHRRKDSRRRALRRFVRDLENQCETKSVAIVSWGEGA